MNAIFFAIGAVGTALAIFFAIILVLLLRRETTPPYTAFPAVVPTNPLTLDDERNIIKLNQE